MPLINYYNLPLELKSGQAGIVEQLESHMHSCAEPGGMFIAICLLDSGLEPLSPESISPIHLEGGHMLSKLRIAFPKADHISWAALKKCLIFVLSLPGKEDLKVGVNHHVLGEATADFLSMLEADYGICVSASLTQPFESLTACESAVRDALVKADFARFIEEPASVIDPGYYEGMKTMLARQHPEYRLVNYERPLIAAVLNQNLAHAELVLQKLLIAFLCDPIFVFPGMRSSLANMLRLTMAMSSIDPKAMSDEDERFQKLQWHVQNCSQLSDMKQYIHRFFQVLAEYSAKELELSNTSLKAQNIMEYIHQNYNNPQLDGVMVSGQFEITPSYLSRMFKEYMGVNLSIYLQTVRLTRAKELLAKTELSIDQIAEEVGYIGRQSLVRLFRKFEGVNPSIYRNLATGQSEMEEKVKN